MAEESSKPTPKRRRRAIVRAGERITVELVGASEDDGHLLLSEFIKQLQAVKSALKQTDAPEDFDLPALEAYRDLGTMLDKHVAGITITTSRRRKVQIDKKFETKVSEIIGPDELIEGSLSGMLEWLNLHNTSIFHIYP